MEATHVAELTTILCEVLNWNKARCQCLAHFVLGVLAVCTVTLSKIATTFSGGILLASRQKRLQRFVAWLANQQGFQMAFGKLVLKQLIGQKLILSIDRTNWKFGKSHINFLVVGVWFEGVSIPIYWVNLGAAGNSSTSLRIETFKQLLNVISVSDIQWFLADREFIGEEWFKYLIEVQIPFAIRIKDNVWARTQRGKYHKSRKVADHFLNIKQGKTKTIKRCTIYGCTLNLAACLSSEGDLVVIATNWNPRFAVKTYKQRWSIETLFSCLKGRGFNFEDTHIVEPRRGEALLFVLSLAFFWSMRIGTDSIRKKPLNLATHGRVRVSIFRRGLNLLRECIIQLHTMLETLILYINVLERSFQSALCKS